MEIKKSNLQKITTLKKVKMSSKSYNQDSNDNYEGENFSEMSNNERGELVQRKWQWASPLIEGVPPCPRGGHSATKTGGCIIIFGVRIPNHLQIRNQSNLKTRK